MAQSASLGSHNFDSCRKWWGRWEGPKKYRTWWNKWELAQEHVPKVFKRRLKQTGLNNWIVTLLYLRYNPRKHQLFEVRHVLWRRENVTEGVKMGMKRRLFGWLVSETGGSLWSTKTALTLRKAMLLDAFPEFQFKAFLTFFPFSNATTL